MDTTGKSRTLEVQGWVHVLEQFAAKGLEFIALQDQMYIERPNRDLRDLPRDLTVVDLRTDLSNARMGAGVRRPHAQRR